MRLLDGPYSKSIFLSEFLTVVLILMMSNRYSDIELKNGISQKFLKFLIAIMSLSFLFNSYAFYNTIFKPMMLLARVYKGKNVDIEKHPELKKNLKSFKMNAKFRRLVIFFSV